MRDARQARIELAQTALPSIEDTVDSTKKDARRFPSLSEA